jgi:hypothetical protein
MTHALDTPLDTNVSQRRFVAVRCGRATDNRIRAKRLQKHGKRPTERMPEEGLEPPTRGL